MDPYGGHAATGRFRLTKASKWFCVCRIYINNYLRLATELHLGNTKRRAVCEYYERKIEMFCAGAFAGGYSVTITTACSRDARVDSSISQRVSLQSVRLFARSSFDSPRVWRITDCDEGSLTLKPSVIANRNQGAVCRILGLGSHKPMLPSNHHDSLYPSFDLPTSIETEIEVRPSRSKRR